MLPCVHTASVHDDDRALADLSADDAAKLMAELEESDKKRVPLAPTGDGAESAPEASGAHPELIKNPGKANAEEFETGMM
jgi:hypothetical protein